MFINVASSCEYSSVYTKPEQLAMYYRFQTVDGIQWFDYISEFLVEHSGSAEHIRKLRGGGDYKIINS